LRSNPTNVRANVGLASTRSIRPGKNTNPAQASTKTKSHAIKKRMA
jgi:hypothetical protein